MSETQATYWTPKKIRDVMYALKCEWFKRKYPDSSIIERGVPTDAFKNNANGLTSQVIKFLNYSGHQAERTGNQGTFIEGKIHRNVLGHVQVVEKGRRIKSSGTKGTSDIKSVIRGRAVAIEIKFGKDRQSEAQKKYEESVKKAGGQYWIVRTMPEFLDMYYEFVTKLATNHV